jgi:hypothetical protein
MNPNYAAAIRLWAKFVLEVLEEICSLPSPSIVTPKSEEVITIYEPTA